MIHVVLYFRQWFRFGESPGFLNFSHQQHCLVQYTLVWLIFSQEDSIPPCESSLNPFYSKKKVWLTISSYFPRVSFRLKLEKIFMQLWLNLWKTHIRIGKKKKECMKVALARGMGSSWTDYVRSHEETKCRELWWPNNWCSLEKLKIFKPARLAISQIRITHVSCWAFWGLQGLSLNEQDWVLPVLTGIMSTQWAPSRMKNP